ncbi:tetratricopeptide repeat protein [Geobacter pelophilus]|uniref:Tetratricopeptide repeat protein n=1 Tax=Geoanaerobacter pelophilus TaxID=60036 RepID=A0AAW4L0G0_9BACT|nr:tetratricopeptide repeat protein [Geoanaerobacter pelophilus]MBT0664549.1 tetratricopeptide repeat protein [Geoanaerobacter pelophilus]
MIRLIIMLVLLFTITSNAFPLEKDYQSFYQAGIAKNKAGNFAEAIKLYSEAIRLKPDSPELFFVRGRAYKQNDQLELAYKDLSKSIELRPAYPEALNLRGVTGIGLNRLKDTKTDLKKACDLGSKDACKNLVKFKDLLK